jgi:hypothetical protein
MQINLTVRKNLINMALEYYNRYNDFLVSGQQTVVPYVKLTPKTTDRVYIYKQGQSRLDKVSQQFYNSPFFGWLILQANPQFSSNEFEIPDGTVLTIPFPLLPSLQDYKGALETHFYYYGR